METDIIQYLDKGSLDSRLRFELHNMGLSFTEFEISLSLNLHYTLISEGLMKLLSPAQVGIAMPSIFRVMYKNQPVQIALFQHLLYLKMRVSKCVICRHSQPTQEISAIAQMLSKRHIYGVTMLLATLSSFPSDVEVGQHRHLLDMCRTCLAHYLYTEISTSHSTVVEHLRCPVMGCDPGLELEQLRFLGTADEIRRCVYTASSN